MSDALRPLRPVALTFALLGGLWWGFDQLLEKRNRPNADIAVGAGAPQRLVLEAGPGGHYVVPGEINGHEVEFIVDTGASHVAVPAGVAERLGLARGRAMRVQTAAGPATAYDTRIDRLSIGGITATDIRASINPSMNSDLILLGMTFLRHVDLRQRGGQLIIETAGS